LIQLGEEQLAGYSLPPPAPCRLTWNEYVNSKDCPDLGRARVLSEMSKGLKAQVAISKDFPLTVEMLLPILEVVTIFLDFQIRNYVTFRLNTSVEKTVLVIFIINYLSVF
jgi:hypothetical protein